MTIQAIDFTSGGLSSHVTAPGSNSIVQANLLECTIAGNESYYGFTETVNYTREIWIEHEMKFSADFDFGQGQKIMRVRSFNGSTNNWDFIVQITSVGSSAQQAGRTDSYQITFSRNSGPTWGVVNKTFTRGQWTKFRYRYYLNSALGVADGVFQCWLDGTLIASYTNLAMIDGSAPAYNATINRILWGGWYSNGAGGNPNAAPEPVTPGVPGSISLQIRNAQRSDVGFSESGSAVFFFMPILFEEG